MRFRVKLLLNFVDGSTMKLTPRTVRAANEQELRALITRDWVIANVSDDWGASHTECANS